MTKRNLSFKKITIEIVFCLWIATTIFVWITLNFGAKETPPMARFPKFDAVFIRINKSIKPYVWRQYIFAEKKVPDSPPK